MNNRLNEAGGCYRNESGEYEVLSIDGERMRTRYYNGSEQTVKIEIQARIWQGILDEEMPPILPGPSDDDSLDTAPVRELVHEVLQARFKYPYPGDITDQVCRAIESNPEWLGYYKSLVEHFSSQGKNGRLTVNSTIGLYTKELTGMVNMQEELPAKSSLIKISRGWVIHRRDVFE
jgi:hypothetical protein